MTISSRLNDALALARMSATSIQQSQPPVTVAAHRMAPLSLTPLSPPRAASTDESAPIAMPGSLPGSVPNAQRELFDRTREQLLATLAGRDFSALPPSWAGVSGRLSQEEATSAAAALQLIAAQVSS